MRPTRMTAAAVAVSAAVLLSAAPSSQAAQYTIQGGAVGALGATYRSWAGRCDPSISGPLNGVDGLFIDVSGFAPRGNIVVNWRAAFVQAQSGGLEAEVSTAQCINTSVGTAIPPSAVQGDWFVPLPGNAKWLFIRVNQAAQITINTR